MKTLLALLLVIPSLSWGEVIDEKYDDWTVTTNIDDFTDEVMILVSTGDVRQYEDQIIFRATEENENNKISIFFNIKRYLVCDDDYMNEDFIEGNLLFRIKKGPLTKIKVKTKEDDQRMFVNYSTELDALDELFSQMLLGDELLVRLEYECEDKTEKEDFKFSIKGFNSVLPYLKD